MGRVLRVTGGLLVILCLAAPAQASFIYDDFSSVAGLQINGDSAQVGNRLRLTPAAGPRSGSAFTTSTVSLGNLNSFSTYFRFQITNPGGISDGDGNGADGIVFVVQTVNNNVGGAGAGIGYGGISPSLGIEFDTYHNGFDPNGNHVGIDVNGSLASIATATHPVRFNNGEIWNAWVDYDGTTDQLEVRWSETAARPIASQLSTTIDLVALLGQSTAFLGFTSGTAAAWGDHDILNWTYRDEFAPIGAVPEPSSVALFAAGAMILLIGRRRGFRRRVRKG